MADLLKFGSLDLATQFGWTWGDGSRQPSFGHVARNVAALGGRCIYIGVIGDDEVGQSIKKEFAAETSIDARLAVEPGRGRHRRL